MKVDKNKRTAVLLIVITLIVGFGNWYFRKVAQNSYAVQLSYNQLYLDPSVIRLKNAVTKNENLEIEMEGSVVGISTNITNKHVVNKNTFIFTPGDTGTIFWIKSPRQPDTLTFSIDFTSEKLYQLASNSGKSNYEIRSSTLNYSESKLYPHNTWAYAFPDLNEDSSRISKYIRDSIGIQGTENSLKKIEKIFAHLIPLIQKNMGLPADSVAYMPALQLLDRMKKNQIKVWCGNMTEILGFFASRTGLPSRVITTEGYSRFAFAVHSFNEIYIPEEKKWIYSDLTTGIAYVLSDDKPMNIIDINRLLRVRIKDSNVKVVYYQDTSTKAVMGTFPSILNTYFNAPQRFRFYYPKYLQYSERNSYGNRIKKFLDPHLNYAFYNEDNHYSNTSFLWRKISTYLLLGVILIDGIFLIILIQKMIVKLFSKNK